MINITYHNKSKLLIDLSLSEKKPTMNGLQITGTKFTAPNPNKMAVLQPKIDKKPTLQTPAKKPSISKTSTSTVKKTAKPVIKAKEEQKKVELIKKQQPKQQQKQEVKVEQPKKPPKQFQVMVRYNHYKQKFKCINSILDFAIVDDKYAFSYVFKGNFLPILKIFGEKQEIECVQGQYTNEQGEKKRSFKWKIEQGTTYGLQIQEDQVQEAKRERKAYKAPVQQKKCPLKKNVRVDLLTQEMKKMGISQLGSEAHKQLLQQRDLQDILYK